MATQLRLKLVIDRKTNKFLFAEAGTEVVDFLFSLLSLPLGSIIKLITKEKLMNTLFFTGTSSTPTPTPTNGRKVYRCPNSCASSADVYAARCSCGLQMTAEVVSMAVIVKGMVTYTVMDDLTITPMSAFSSITMLAKFDVKDVGSLEERTVNLGMSEGLKLLEASLQSRTVLTDVFIDREAAADEAK
ncbi:uncharacterized protein LOC109846627 [Asparagus officinalis]|uniref:uncharacterized protein LOC109846627 n=1 Tax=Asparagus officinalis TaxID=4686 RepID=UPI00098E6D34|nr:uncharacterized protein LOC109846627 [Asparagus officinalis]